MMEHPENSEEYKGLTVNAGIEQPSIVNPYLKLRKKPKRKEYSVAEFVEGIVKGNVTILSQAVTMVESLKPEHQAIAQEVIEKGIEGTKTTDEREAFIREKFTTVLDLKSIGQHVLGNYWKKADATQRQAFLDAFTQLQTKRLMV